MNQPIKDSFKLLVGNLCMVLCMLAAPISVSAAVLSSAPAQIQTIQHQRFEVTVFLDTEEEDINALEGKIRFPEDLLDLREVRDGNSIINFWVERPAKGSSPVTFSGIIPGGYRFPKGLVLSLVFEAKQTGNGTISIEQARTLRNDGQGTDVPLTTSFSSVVVTETVPTPLVPIITEPDINPPEPFVPQMSQDHSIFSGQWFLSFATQDKGSGIDHYEIQESSFWGMGRWRVGESPYVLKGQDPTRAVSVKAVDRAGNERIGTALPVRQRDTTYDRAEMLAILLLVIALLGLLIERRIRPHRRKK